MVKECKFYSFTTYTGEYTGEPYTSFHLHLLLTPGGDPVPARILHSGAFRTSLTRCWWSNWCITPPSSPGMVGCW